MKTNYEIRYAAHPEDAKQYDTTRIRRDFLIERVFAADEVNMVYSMYDRMVVGGAMPVGEALKLEAIDGNRPAEGTFLHHSPRGGHLQCGRRRHRDRRRRDF